MKLTVLIITKNAEETLERTLESLKEFASEVVIVDDFSRDNTTKIAKQFGYQVISHHADGFELQRTYALGIVKTKWVLILDSDEVLTKENKLEIESAIMNNEFNGFYLRFRNHLFGKKLIHGELHKKLVLFKLRSVNITPVKIHEFCFVDGKIGELLTEINHYSYRSFFQVANKFLDYSIRLAKQYKEVGTKLTWKHLFLYPLHMFYARFIKDQGYKDGIARLFLDFQFAQMEFLSYFLIPFVNEKPRVVVDCGGYSPADTVQSGIERLIQGIYTNKSPENDYYWFSYAKSAIHKLPQRFFSHVWLPLATLVNRGDIFLGVGGTIPHLLSLFPIKKILFLYDFGFYASPEKYVNSAARLQSQTNRSVQYADTVVLLNEEMYGEFVRRFPTYAHKAEIILSGADHLNTVKEVPISLQFKEPFILYVGVVKPVKRIDKILSVVGDIHCIIAGPQEEKYKAGLHIGKTQHIQFIKNINDGQLKWLYKKAEVMVYTSKHEGFCYPVLEALTLGLPVVALELPIFKIYQNHFPHLTLVKTEEEMREVLRSKGQSRKSAIKIVQHPYIWKLFNEKLRALWQPRRLPRPVSKKMAFIVVLYKTQQKDKERLEREIRNIGLADYEIYWIDNSTNGKGYGAGINEGIRMGLIDGCEQFVALNPDISLTNINAKALHEVASEFDVWGFAMRQNGETYYGGEIDKWRLSGGLVKAKPKMRMAEVDFVSGSVMGFTKEVVQTIGLWDESYFMYYEDVDYCVRAKRKGFQIGIDTTTEFDHFEVSQLNEKKKKWIERSRWKFFWKYANVKQKIRELIRLPKTIVYKN